MGSAIKTASDCREEKRAPASGPRLPEKERAVAPRQPRRSGGKQSRGAQARRREASAGRAGAHRRRKWRAGRRCWQLETAQPRGRAAAERGGVKPIPTRTSSRPQCQQRRRARSYGVVTFRFQRRQDHATGTPAVRRALASVAPTRLEGAAQQIRPECLRRSGGVETIRSIVARCARKRPVTGPREGSLPWPRSLCAVIGRARSSAVIRGRARVMQMKSSGRRRGPREPRRTRKTASVPRARRCPPAGAFELRGRSGARDHRAVEATGASASSVRRPRADQDGTSASGWRPETASGAIGGKMRSAPTSFSRTIMTNPAAAPLFSGEERPEPPTAAGACVAPRRSQRTRVGSDEFARRKSPSRTSAIAVSNRKRQSVLNHNGLVFRPGVQG